MNVKNVEALVLVTQEKTLRDNVKVTDESLSALGCERKARALANSCRISRQPVSARNKGCGSTESTQKLSAEVTLQCYLTLKVHSCALSYALPRAITSLCLTLLCFYFPIFRVKILLVSDFWLIK